MNGRGRAANTMAEFPQRQVDRAKALAGAEQPPTSEPQADQAATETMNRLESAVKQVGDNPALLAYKLKTAGYKYSWALIPLSVPFMWLLFFWRRDIHAYDHAIFITYSISFMMLFVVLLSVASSLGVSAAIWGVALAIVPPLHLCFTSYFTRVFRKTVGVNPSSYRRRRLISHLRSTRQRSVEMLCDRFRGPP